MINFHIISIFPESFDSYLGSSILARARTAKKIKTAFYNPRAFTTDKHHKVDLRPYGGGPGMVMQAEPIVKAGEKILSKIKDKRRVKVILFSPAGKLFDNKYAEKLAKKYDHLIMIAGHYEGVDARVKKILKAEEVSIGPYVLTGGELPAMIVMDAVTRQIDGVLGNDTSLEEKRTASSETYTRPEVLVHKGKKYRVPKVLLSGNHAEIEKWKKRGK